MIKVEEILKRLKLSGPYPQEEYINKAINLGKDAENFMDVVDTALEQGFTAERWRNIYKLKNKNKKLFNT